MEKEIVWTDFAKNDLQNIFHYLEANWPSKVQDDFILLLNLKIRLLSQHPFIGFRVKNTQDLENH